METRLGAQIERGRSLIMEDLQDQQTYERWRADRRRWIDFTQEVLVQGFNGENYSVPATIDDPVILDEITQTLQGLGYTRSQIP